MFTRHPPPPTVPTSGMLASSDCFYKMRNRPTAVDTCPGKLLPRMLRTHTAAPSPAVGRVVFPAAQQAGMAGSAPKRSTRCRAAREVSRPAEE